MHLTTVIAVMRGKGEFVVRALVSGFTFVLEQYRF